MSSADTAERAGTTPPPAAPGEPPGPPGHWLLGHSRQLSADALGGLRRAFEGYGDVAALRFGPYRACLLAHPAHVEHVLQRHHRNYDKQVFTYRRLRAFLGNGIVTADGDDWRRQRRAVQPAFHRDRLNAYGETALRVAEDVRAAWRAAAARGEPVDVHRDMAHATLRVVAKAVLGTEISGDADVVGRALGRGLEAVIRRIYAFVPLPLAVPTPVNRDLSRARRDLHRIAAEVIEERRRMRDRPDDLLTVLIDDPHRGRGPRAERQLRDEITTFLLAGHETTANALTWTWHCLARHPEIAARVRADLGHKLGGRPPTVDDLPRLDGARMALKEAMRLYPPVWAIDRRTVADDVVGGWRIRAGTMAIVSPYVTHRHPAFWDEPERFDPLRFAPAAESGRPRFAYLPFGGGPRGCIGGSFALLEGTLMLAALLPHVELSPAPGHEVELDASVTLRPRGPVMMTVREIDPAGTAPRPQR